MSNTATLNRDDMERRRLSAAQELLEGVPQARVARKYGVSRTTASRWHRALSQKGYEALRKRRATGRPTRLNAQQMTEVRNLYFEGARVWGYPTDRWTTARFARAIEGRFGVKYDPDHVGRIMHRLGLRQARQCPWPVQAESDARSYATM